MPRIVPLPPADAVAAVAAVAGPAPETGKYVAHQDENSFLTVVAVQDALDRGFPHVWAGGGWLVGPDGKVFSLSSNSGIHDWDLAKRLLRRLYEADLGPRFTAEAFVDRLTRLTEERGDLVEAVVREVMEGRLRHRQPRSLP